MSDYDKEAVIQILQDRDDMDEHEARELVAEVQETIDGMQSEADDHTFGGAAILLEELENVISEEFGLEPDYLEDFMF